MTSCEPSSFVTSLDSFLASLNESTAGFKNGDHHHLGAGPAMRFVCSPSIAETAKLYHNRHTFNRLYNSTAKWKCYFIQFLDVGAFMEFKHLLAQVGKDVLKLSALQHLLLQHTQLPHTRKHKSKLKQTNTPLLISVVALPSSRINSDILWSKYLIEILVRHATLLTQTRVNSTLGGAYASLQRIHVAAWWARYQLSTAIKLGDTFQQAKSTLHLAFYYIRIHKFKAARHILREQRLVPAVVESDVLQTIADAAELALSKEILAMREHKKKHSVCKKAVVNSLVK